MKRLRRTLEGFEAGIVLFMFAKVFEAKITN